VVAWGRWSVGAALTAMSLAVPAGNSLAAQAGAKDTKTALVPASAMPPAGMCRVWLRDVPEHQQPAPTDCTTAIKTMPRDAQVLFGDLQRAATVAAPGTVSAFRGTGGNNGEVRSAAQAAAAAARAVGGRQGIVGGRQGIVGVSSSAPVAAKAPEAKAVIKPEKPQ